MNTKYLVVLIVPFLLVGCRSNEKADRAGRATHVEVMEIGNMSTSANRRFSGTVEEEDGAALSFSVPGTVQHIYVYTGQTVSKGQLIATVDPTLLQSSYNAAKATLDQARDAYERLKVLYEKKSLPEIKWIEMQSKLEQAQSMEEMARKNLNDCRLTAPFGGVVAEKCAEAGQNILPGIPVIKLMSVSQVKVKVPVPEADISHIEKGSRAWVRIPAAGDACIEGKVVEKGVVAHPLSRSYEVKIAIDNKDRSFFPGMVTEVYIDDSSRRSAVVIPAHIVQTDENNRHFVWLHQKGKAFRRVVECGEFTAQGVIIESGLAPGEQVIISGQHKVCEGCPVTLHP